VLALSLKGRSGDTVLSYMLRVILEHQHTEADDEHCCSCYNSVGRRWRIDRVGQLVDWKSSEIYRGEEWVEVAKLGTVQASHIEIETITRQYGWCFKNNI